MLVSDGGNTPRPTILSSLAPLSMVGYKRRCIGSAFRCHVGEDVGSVVGVHHDGHRRRSLRDDRPKQRDERHRWTLPGVVHHAQSKSLFRLRVVHVFKHRVSTLWAVLKDDVWFDVRTSARKLLARRTEIKQAHNTSRLTMRDPSMHACSTHACFGLSAALRPAYVRSPSRSGVLAYRGRLSPHSAPSASAAGAGGGGLAGGTGGLLAGPPPGLASDEAALLLVG